MSSPYFKPALPATSGFYYRMPSGTARTSDGQILPKYYNLLNIPYLGIIYPTTDQYAGLMIVKTFQPIHYAFPEIEPLSQFEIYLELKRIVNQEFTL